MMRRLFPALLLILLSPRSAWAEPAPKKDETDKKAEKAAATKSDKKTPPKPPPPAPIEVRVIGDKADALQKIPGSGSLVTKKEIERAQPADTAEMLRRVPGLWVRQDTGAGLRLDIGVRGLDGSRARRVLVLEDGIPVAINPYGEPDLYYAPPIERMRGVEVVKGSGSILFGPQTIGGVVNFLTVLPPSEGKKITVQADGGQRGYLKFLSQYGDTWGDARYVVQGFFKRGDGFRSDPFQSADLMGKLALPAGRTGELTIKLGAHDERANSSDIGLTLPMYEADPMRPSIVPDDQVRVQRYEASVIHEMLLDEATRIRTLVYTYATARFWRRQDYDRAPMPGVFYQKIVGSPEVEGGAIYFRDTSTIRDRNYHVLGVEPRLEKRFATGPFRHTLETGARVLVETAHRAIQAGSSTLAEGGDVVSDERSTTMALAAYAQDRIAFRDDLLVTPGLRFELARSSRQIDVALIEGEAREVDISGASTTMQFIPGIGMVYGDKRANVFGGLHLGFAPPRVVTAIDPTGRDLLLEPERSINYELGARLLPWRFFRIEATGFLSNFENQIVPSNRAGGTTTDLINAGKTRHLGVEGALSFGLGKALSLGTTIDLGLRATLSRATFAEGPFEGNRLPYAPLISTSATLDIEHPSGLGGQVAYAFVGPQFSDEANTAAPDASGRVGELDGYHIVDLGARYRNKATGLTFGVSVKNLLNQIYIVSRRPDGIFPAGFRQVNVSLRWEHH